MDKNKDHSRPNSPRPLKKTLEASDVLLTKESPLSPTRARVIGKMPAPKIPFIVLKNTREGRFKYTAPRILKTVIRLYCLPGLCKG